MADTAEAEAAIDGIDADVNYVVDDGIPLVRYVDWPEEEHKAHRPSYETKRVRVLNGRTCGETFTLASHGFTFLNRPTAVKDFFARRRARSSSRSRSRAGRSRSPRA